VTPRLPSRNTDAYWVYANAPDMSRARGYTGKWLIYVPTMEIDGWWKVIATATRLGELGWRAKAATARPKRMAGDPRVKLICVYTRDWRDEDDVRQVLARLRELNVTWRLSYKTDRATLEHRYGRGVAIYVSQPESANFDIRIPSGPVSPSGGGGGASGA
jgi:hypothetical protein